MSFNVAMLEALQAEGLDLAACIRVLKAGERSDDNTNAARQARYRARKQMRDEDWYALRGQVFERDGYECQYCGTKEELACDHVIPLIKGGTNDIDNLTTACRSCNSSKSGRTPEEWLAE